ncbi:MAG: DUF4136 domain-containing protein [Pseudomonadota bacterium]
MSKLQNAPVIALWTHVLRNSLAIVTLAVGAAMLTTGCTAPAPKPQSMRDSHADFNAFRTFDWKAADSDQPLSILDSNIRSAISSELQGKGYAQAAAGTNPDLVISFETARAETIKSSPFRFGIGVGSVGGSSGGSVGASTSGVKNITEGTLFLRAVDPARKAEVWTGQVTREL